MKSKINGLFRNIMSFVYFNRQLFRWPANFIEQSKRNIDDYGNNKVFQKHVEALPNWIPLKLRIIWHSGSVAWSLSGIDFSTGLIGFYTHTIVEKVVNDLAISLILNEEIPRDLMDDFVKYEEAVKNNNLSGTGRVWDFYDSAYQHIKFDKPHVSMLDLMKDVNFIQDVTYVKYLPKLQQLDRVLVENDAVMYSGSNAEVLLGDYDDSYYAGRVYKESDLTLTKLLEMKK